MPDYNSTDSSSNEAILWVQGLMMGAFLTLFAILLLGNLVPWRKRVESDLYPFSGASPSRPDLSGLGGSASVNGSVLFYARINGKSEWPRNYPTAPFLCLVSFGLRIPLWPSWSFPQRTKVVYFLSFSRGNLRLPVGTQVCRISSLHDFTHHYIGQD